jgi:hypothetical protein
VEENILTPLLWGKAVFLGPIKEGTVGLLVHLCKVEASISAHLLLATEVFLGHTKGGAMVVVLVSEVPVFR